MDKIMIIAGEASGDLHGASLISELRKLNPNFQFFGIGGDKMIEQGLHVSFHSKETAIIGFVEVIKHLPFIKRVQRELLKVIAEQKIQHLILIDYPGFNLNFAKKVKKLGMKITYYISPQIWAWGRHRVKNVRRLIDKMIVVFPFEKDFYARNNVNVEYVGHPLVERLNVHTFLSKEELINKANLNPSKEILLVMPGSRKSEIEKIFPACIEAAEKISKEFDLQTVVACSNDIEESTIRNICPDGAFTIVKGFTYDLIKHSQFGIIKSGTSTLECTLLGLPFVVIYKTSAMSYQIGKRLIKIKNLAMPNIIAGKNIVKEFIQSDVEKNKITDFVSELLNNNSKIEELKSNLRLVKEKLGGNGAAQKAAAIIYAQLNES